MWNPAIDSGSTCTDESLSRFNIFSMVPVSGYYHIFLPSHTHDMPRSERRTSPMKCDVR